MVSAYFRRTVATRAYRRGGRRRARAPAKVRYAFACALVAVEASERLGSCDAHRRVVGRNVLRTSAHPRGVSIDGINVFRTSPPPGGGGEQIQLWSGHAAYLYY